MRLNIQTDLNDHKQKIQNCKDLAQQWIALANQPLNQHSEIYRNCADQLALLVGSNDLSGVPDVILEAEIKALSE